MRGIDEPSAGAPTPAAIVLHGPTSAGKSSLAKALQDGAPVPAFHVVLDAFVTMSRRRDMHGPQEEGEAYRLHCENLRSTLARLADTRFEIVVDLVLLEEAQLQECLRVLSGRPLYLVGVRAPLDILEERERRRDDRAAGWRACRARIRRSSATTTWSSTRDVQRRGGRRRHSQFHPVPAQGGGALDVGG